MSMTKRETFRLTREWHERERVRIVLTADYPKEMLTRYHDRRGIVVHLEELTEGTLATYGDLTVWLEATLENPREEYQTFFRRECEPLGVAEEVSTSKST